MDGCQCTFVAQLTWNWIFARESGCDREWVLCEFRNSVARGADNNIMLWFADDEHHPPGRCRLVVLFSSTPAHQLCCSDKNDVSSLNRSRAEFRMFQARLYKRIFDGLQCFVSPPYSLEKSSTNLAIFYCEQRSEFVDNDTFVRANSLLSTRLLRNTAAIFARKCWIW